MNFRNFSLFSAAFLGVGLIVSGTLIFDSAGTLPVLSFPLGQALLSTTNIGTTATVAGIGALAIAGALATSQLIDIRRKKRSETCLPISNPDVFFTLAANSDHLGCGMRLICELELTSDDKLSKEERLILGLFGRSPKPVNKDELSTAKSGFQYAAFVGANAEDISECSKVFNNCPFDRITMMKAFKKVNKASL